MAESIDLKNLIRIPSLATLVLLGGLIWQSFLFVAESRQSDAELKATDIRMQNEINALRGALDDNVGSALSKAAEERRYFDVRISRLEVIADQMQRSDRTRPERGGGQ